MLKTFEKIVLLRVEDSVGKNVHDTTTKEELKVYIQAFQM